MVWIVYTTLGWLFTLGIAYGFGFYAGVDKTEAKYGRSDTK